jgi:hypothetical protein
MAVISKRRLTLLDLLMLVAAMGFGLGLVHLFDTIYYGTSARFMKGEYSWACFGLLVVAFSIGWLILRFRQPRPTLRRLACQPGFIAAVRVLFWTFSSTIRSLQECLILMPLRPEVRWEGFRSELLEYLHELGHRDYVGPSIALVWLILALQRTRLRNADWLEWQGRVLGLVILGAWIIPSVVDWFQIVRFVIRRQ